MTVRLEVAGLAEAFVAAFPTLSRGLLCAFWQVFEFRAAAVPRHTIKDNPMFRRFHPLSRALPGTLVPAFAGIACLAAAAPALAQTPAAPTAGVTLWGMFEPTVVTVASGLVGLAVTWAAARFHALTGVQIDQKYQDDLHRAADTGINLALSKGGTIAGDVLAGNAKLIAVGEAMKWVNASVPDALKALGVTPDQVRDIVAAKLNKVLSAAPSATAVAVAPVTETKGA